MSVVKKKKNFAWKREKSGGAYCTRIILYGYLSVWNISKYQPI